MLCMLQCKWAVGGNLTLAENEEDLTNYEDIDIRISLEISDSGKSHSISSAPLTVSHNTIHSVRHI